MLLDEKRLGGRLALVLAGVLAELRLAVCARAMKKCALKIKRSVIGKSAFAPIICAVISIIMMFFQLF